MTVCHDGTCLVVTVLSALRTAMVSVHAWGQSLCGNAQGWCNGDAFLSPNAWQLHKQAYHNSARCGPSELRREARHSKPRDWAINWVDCAHAQLGWQPQQSLNADDTTNTTHTVIQCLRCGHPPLIPFSTLWVWVGLVLHHSAPTTKHHMPVLPLSSSRKPE